MVALQSLAYILDFYMLFSFSEDSGSIVRMHKNRISFSRIKTSLIATQVKKQEKVILWSLLCLKNTCTKLLS